MLSSNLKQISDELTKSELEDSRVTKCLSKLCDHVTLEMQRMTVFESLYSEIEKTRNEFSETAEKGTAFIEATIENQKSELEKLGEDNEKSIRKVQRDYIAILGIFAAVVLVFNSSIGFSSSVVEVAGAKYSFSNLLLIVLIIGFIIANTVAVLFGFVWKMIREDDDHAPAAAWKTLSMMNAILIVGIICLLVRSLFFPGMP